MPCRRSGFLEVVECRRIDYEVGVAHRRIWNREVVESSLEVDLHNLDLVEDHSLEEDSHEVGVEHIGRRHMDREAEVNDNDRKDLLSKEVEVHIDSLQEEEDNHHRLLQLFLHHTEAFRIQPLVVQSSDQVLVFELVLVVPFINKEY